MKENLTIEIEELMTEKNKSEKTIDKLSAIIKNKGD